MEQISYKDEIEKLRRFNKVMDMIVESISGETKKKQQDMFDRESKQREAESLLILLDSPMNSKGGKG